MSQKVVQVCDGCGREAPPVPADRKRFGQHIPKEWRIVKLEGPSGTTRKSWPEYCPDCVKLILELLPALEAK